MASDGGSARSVVVVGAGISGISCARVLADAGVDVVVLDRGDRIGGRMAVRTVTVAGRSRVVDVGASYLTVRDEVFADVVESWRARGLARPWTSAAAVLGPQPREVDLHVQWWAAASGLRSLVEDLAHGLDVTSGHEVEDVGVGDDGRPHVDGTPADAVVLAMPDPQAADLLPEPFAFELGLTPEWNPVICVWAAWPQRWWPPLTGAFVDGPSLLTWIADDGDRRGDGAPVLVAHVSPETSALHLDAPDAVVPGVLAELTRLLGGVDVPPPDVVRARRWSLASPRRPHSRAFGLLDVPAGWIGVCGDGWGPRPRVEQAWRSGRDLGHALLERLGVDRARAGRA